MKKHPLRIVLPLFLILLLTVMPACAAGDPFGMNPHTKSLLLVDLTDGSILYDRNSTQVLPCASLTKIMTYIVTMESIDDPLHTMLTVKQTPIDSISGMGASTAGLEYHIGEAYSVLDILRGMMIASGCEAAEVLAYEIGNGNSAVFVQKMNEKAASLGCTDTHFEDAHGLSEKDRTTARDLVKITSYALTLPYFREIVSTEYYTLPGMTKPMINTNLLIDAFNGGRYYDSYAKGVKTGYTYAAGRCLVTLAQKGEKEYLAVALGGQYQSADGYLNHAMVDTKAMLSYAFTELTDTILPAFPYEIRSVGIGETLTLSASVVRNSTGETPYLTYESSDPAVALVDQTGKVTGKSRGEVTITVTSQTGNHALCRVSVGYYHAISVNADTGDYTGGAYSPVSFDAIRDYGMDLVILPAAVTQENGEYLFDEKLEEKIEAAFSRSLAVCLSLPARAISSKEGNDDAQALIQFWSGFPSSLREKLTLPVLYDLSDVRYQSMSAAAKCAIAEAFAASMGSENVKTMIVSSRNGLSGMTPETLAANGIGLYAEYCPYEVDFSAMPLINGSVRANGWLYRGDGWLPGASDASLQSEFSLLDRAFVTMPTFQSADPVPDETTQTPETDSPSSQTDPPESTVSPIPSEPIETKPAPMTDEPPISDPEASPVSVWVVTGVVLVICLAGIGIVFCLRKNGERKPKNGKQKRSQG